MPDMVPFLGETHDRTLHMVLIHLVKIRGHKSAVPYGGCKYSKYKTLLLSISTSVRLELFLDKISILNMIIRSSGPS